MLSESSIINATVLFLEAAARRGTQSKSLAHPERKIRTMCTHLAMHESHGTLCEDHRLRRKDDRFVVK